MAEMNEKTSDQDEKPKSKSSFKVKWILIGVAILVLCYIALQNRAETKVSILLIESQMPLAVLIIITAGLGFALGYLSAIFRRRR